MYRFVLLALVCLLAIVMTLFAVPVVTAQTVQVPGETGQPNQPSGTPPPLSPGVPAETAEPQGPLLPRISPGAIEITTPRVIRSIEFKGNTVIPAADLEKAAGLSVGQVATEADVEQAIASIEQLYQDRGFIGAVVNVDIPKQVLGGPLVFYIEELRVTGIRLEGLRRVSESAISRMISTKPGQVFNREQAIQDYIRLQQLDVFDDISFDLEPVRSGEAILVWKFKEKAQFNYVSLGGSYGPSDGLIGSLELTLGNLRRRAERLRMLGSISSVDARVSGEASYLNPWIAKDTALLLDVYSKVIYRFSRNLIVTPVSDRYAERHTGFSGYIDKKVKPSFSLMPGIRVENVNILNIPSDELTSINQDSTIGLANLRATWDHRDSITNPTIGTYTIGFFEGGVASQELSGTGGIAKLWGDRRWYLPMSNPKLDPVTGLPTRRVPVLALRGLLAGTAGDLPFFEQYFVGGISDLPLRGYLDDRFWGKYALVGNIEARFPFTESLAGVVFADVGDAWGSDFEFAPNQINNDFLPQDEGFRLHVGVGVGIRYATPAGPVRIDFAYGDAFRTYLSVGQQF